MKRRWCGLVVVGVSACSTTATNSMPRAEPVTSSEVADVWADATNVPITTPPPITPPTTATTTPIPTSTTTTTPTTAPAVPLVDVGERTVEPADPAMPISMRLPVAATRPFFDDLIASWATVVESEFAARARTLIRDRERAARLAAEQAARVAAERAAAERAAAEAAAADESATTITTAAPTTTTTTTLPPDPPPPPPELTVDFDPVQPDDHHTLVRLRTTTQLGDFPETTTTALYALADGRVVTSSALIAPDARATVVEMLAARIGELASDWTAVTPDRLLVDVSFTDAGHVRVRIPTRFLVPGADPATSVVVFDRDEMIDLLSPVAALIAADMPAPAREVAEPISCEVRRCVAITYDDGPTDSTERVLDVLDNADVEATFFVVGRLVEARPELTARMAAAGHAIGNHTWSHPNLRQLDPDAIADEIDRTDEVIRTTTGIRTQFLRPPYGRYDDEVRYTVDKGIAIWDVDTRDWQHRDPAVTVRAVMDQVAAGSVILLHDAFPTAADVTALLISELRAAGYALVTLPQLLGPAEPGRVYYSQSYSDDPPPPTTTTTTTTTTMPPTTVAAARPDTSP